MHNIQHFTHHSTYVYSVSMATFRVYNYVQQVIYKALNEIFSLCMYIYIYIYIYVHRSTTRSIYDVTWSIDSTPCSGEC